MDGPALLSAYEFFNEMSVVNAALKLGARERLGRGEDRVGIIIRLKEG